MRKHALPAVVVAVTALIVTAVLAAGCSSTAEIEVTQTTTTTTTLRLVATTVPRSPACDRLHGLAEQAQADWERAADHLEQLDQRAADVRDRLEPFARLENATESIVRVSAVWDDTCMGISDDDDLYGVNLRLSADIMSGYLENTCEIIGLTDC